MNRIKNWKDGKILVNLWIATWLLFPRIAHMVLAETGMTKVDKSSKGNNTKKDFLMLTKGTNKLTKQYKC
jgi:hypothetical protein